MYFPYVHIKFTHRKRIKEERVQRKILNRDEAQIASGNAWQNDYQNDNEDKEKNERAQSFT